MSTEHAPGAAPTTLAAGSLEPLLAGLVDYAGTFPPAGLDVERACACFAAARAGRSAWIASRFAVALGDVAAVDAWLEGSEAAGGASSGGRSEQEADPRAADPDRWPITAVVGPAWDAAPAVAAAASERVRLDAYECRVASADDVAAAADALGPLVTAPTDVVVEVPGDDEATWPALLDAIAARGLRAKLRTGSVRAAEIPTSATVARFLEACASRDLPIKLTAGLHRALRAVRPLTYEADGPCGSMHGFVNAYAAAGLAFVHGLGAVALERCLDATDASAFEATDAGLLVRAHGAEALLTTDHLRELRARRVAAFGSCSFDEPVEDLIGLGWLDPRAAD